MLVVGPSGVGKDSVIDGARALLAGDSRFVFPQRFVTRPAQAGGEAHHAVGDSAFRAIEASGGFALSWRAHGLSYGVPRGIEDELAAGRAVVVNVSRDVVDAARARLAPVRVAVITAPIPVLAKRLAARGRESRADIEERLRRAAGGMPGGSDVVLIDNSGALEQAVDAFVAALKDTGAAPGR